MTENRAPWYQTTRRWGQTNITEIDPTRYDVEWWRSYWRRTQVQGVIINAGGIVAYYPSRYREQYRARFLEERDLFGELLQVAHEDGLTVLARMDSNRATLQTLHEHPEWFTRQASGEPYQAGDRYITCINSAYYSHFLPDVLREIIVNYRPEGFTDNSWSGLGREQICYCRNCERKFFDDLGEDLPAAVNWADPVYRQWVRWSYGCRLEVWDRNNGVTQAVGGHDCLWLGMNSGDIAHQSNRLRDMKAIAERSELMMVDYQTRGPGTPFYHNGQAGKLIHGLMGWDKLAPESMAQYQGRTPTFRLASKPAPEVHLWMEEGIAGGLQPWWHFISAYHEDRRQYLTPEALLRWHAAHEEYLHNRTPVANIGVLWSQENLDFYGRDAGHERVMLPYEGICRALIRARIPYLPLHIDHVNRDGANFTTLILPNLAAVSAAQVASLQRFVEQGGNLIATGESTLYDEWGERRPDFALADLFGAHTLDEHEGELGSGAGSWESYAQHTYLRLTPALGAGVDGPHHDDEPGIEGERHAVLHGFAATDILPFGGQLQVVDPAWDAAVPLTWIPAFPIYPPEFAWMDQTESTNPALILRTTEEGSRIAYLPADLDRCFARYHLPDHGDLLANVVRWASYHTGGLEVEGDGLIDCHLYHQPGRVILHLVNLAGSDAMPLESHLPVGPLVVTLRLPDDVTPTHATLLVAGNAISTTVQEGWVRCEIPQVRDHEVLVIGE